MPTLNFRDIPQSPLTRALGLIIDDLGNDGDTGAGCTWLTGHIDAGPEHHQPMGIVHGAVYTGAVETAASVGATASVYHLGQYAVGVDNFTDFVRPVTRERLRVEARAAQQGRTLQLWDVAITNEAGKLVAKGRVRLAIRPRPDAGPDAGLTGAGGPA
ncbi:MAG TPA: PaaI family thioesterase [Streptosporangiaceae bacterium]|nr:PaaI family thioesterase [Streptosporangiaceae bacterium]